MGLTIRWTPRFSYLVDRQSLTQVLCSLLAYSNTPKNQCREALHTENNGIRITDAMSDLVLLDCSSIRRQGE